jgi:hypothetical protein
MGIYGKNVVFDYFQDLESKKSKSPDASFCFYTAL